VIPTAAYPRTPAPPATGPKPWKPRPFRPVIKPVTPKYMTLIAGFHCTDGFVIAGDTQITIGNTAVQGHKLVSCDGYDPQYAIRIGIAGDESYALAACQDIRDAVAALPSATFPEIKQAVKLAIEAVYNDQIFPVWQATGQRDDPYVCLILGVKDVNGQFGVLKTDRNSVREVDHHVCAGAGNEVAEVLIERLLGDVSLSTAVTEQLVCQLFREVKQKRSGVYVGGNTEIISLRSPTSTPGFHLALSIGDERFLWGLDDLVIEAVRAALSDTLTPSEVTEMLDNNVAEIRSRLASLQRDSHAESLYTIFCERHLENGTDSAEPGVCI
jgi:hypothetical protein